MNTGFRYSNRLLLRLALAATALFICTPLPRAAAVEIVAHRGGYLDAPENTCAAFRSCEGQADRIEFDVRRSADNELVVIHDATVIRTTTGYDSLTNVAAMTLAQLQTLDAGIKYSPEFAGESIPTFVEALRALPPGIPALVDCKVWCPEAIVQTLRAENAVSNAQVASDTLNFLQAVHVLEPSLSLCYWHAGSVTPAWLAMLRSNGVFTVGWDKNVITPDGIDLIHAAGMRVMARALSTPETGYFRALGVDALLVNNPRTARAFTNDAPSSNVQLARELVAYWKLDDGLENPQTNVSEDVEGRSPGRLGGFDSPPSWLASEEARAGGALRLDGINDRVLLPVTAPIDIGTNAVTLSVWVKLTVLPGDLSINFSSIFDSSSDSYVIYLDQAARELRFKVTDSRPLAARPGIPEANLRTGVWHHVVGVYDGSAGRMSGEVAIYLDGRIQDIHSGNDYTSDFGLTNVVHPGQVAALGRNGTIANQYFSGDVDDVAIWRRALSPAEIRQIYEAGTNGVPLEKKVMTLWIANVYPDLETGDMQLDLRVEHGSLTNQALQLRGAALATGNYADLTSLKGGRGCQPHFRVPSTRFSNTNELLSRRDANRPNYFQVVCP